MKGPIDWAVIQELRKLQSTSNPNLVAEIFSAFIQSSEKNLAEMSAAAVSGNSQGVAKAVHKLKSSAGSLGASQLANLSLNLETLAKSGKLPPDVSVLIEEIQTELRVICEELKRGPRAS